MRLPPVWEQTNLNMHVLARATPFRLRLGQNMMQGHENRLCVFNEGLFSAIAAVAHSCDPYEAGAATRIVANFAGDSEVRICIGDRLL